MTHQIALRIAKNSLFRWTVLFFLASSFVTSAVHAGNIYWALNSNGDWEVAGNWSPAGLPGSGDDVLFGRLAGTQDRRTRIGSNRTVNLIDVGYGADLHINSGLTTGELQTNAVIVSGSSSRIRVEENVVAGQAEDALKVTGSGGFEITDMGTLEMRGGILHLTAANATLDNFGLFSNSTGGVNGYGTIDMDATHSGSVRVFNNSGRLRANGGTMLLTVGAGNGFIDLDGTAENGIVDVASNSSLIVDGQIADLFHGEMNLADNSLLDMAYDWTLSTGTVNVDAGVGSSTMRGGQLFMSNGVLNVNSGTARFENTFVQNSGTVNLAANTTLELPGTSSISSMSRDDSSSLIITGNSNVSHPSSNFDWDGAGGAGTTVAGSGSLQINASQVDVADDKFDAALRIEDSASVHVFVADNEWNLNGSLTKANTGTGEIGGDKMLVSGDVLVDNGRLDITGDVEVRGIGSSFTVASGATAHVDADNKFGFGSVLTVDGVLQLNGATDWNGPSMVTGQGKIVNNGSANVTGNTTIDIATLDWDQGPTMIQPGRTLTLNVDRIDTSNDDYNDSITVDSGFLNVHVADGEWRLANNSQLNFSKSGSDIPTLDGSRVVLTGTGQINVNGGLANILSDIELQSGTEIAVIGAGSAIRLWGETTLSGANITAPAGFGQTFFQGPVLVSGNSQISTSGVNWSNGPVTIQPGGALEINTITLTPIEDTLLIDSGSIEISQASDEWQMDGTLHLRNSALLMGDGIDVQEANIVVDGGGVSSIQARTAYGWTTNLSIAAGSILAHDGPVELTPDNFDISLTSAGTLRFNNTISVDNTLQLDLFEVLFQDNAAAMFAGGEEIVFTNGTFASFSDPVTFQGNGQLRAESGAIMSLADGLVVDVPVVLEDSELRLNSVVISQSELASLTMDNQSTLRLKLGGTASGEYDSLTLQSTSAIDGTLQVVLNGGFVPTAGNSFELVTANNGFAAGFNTFDTVDFPTVGGLSFEVDYTATSVLLNVVSLMTSGDFNGDGNFDCQDIDSLVSEIANGTNNSLFDVTGDGLVNVADRDEWLAQAGAANLPSGSPYLLGDADLDGFVDGTDFLAWNSSKFSNTAAWCSGDFTADGVVDGADFLAWNSNKFTSADALAVPEPAVGGLLLLLACVVFKKRSE